MLPLTRMQTLLRDAQGASAIEYGLIMGLITLVIVVAMQSVADETIGMWGNVNDKTSEAISSSG
ncbi:Flp family type IVb pilin [Novosphingobium mangrovi (ex Hu et al. 2023)]|uniref:Flp family type IVb pilin n=1 Tax=Novosphingobium mangrovi (ex Hu et al. 2023) TaxID=2930094 RepID=UPI002E114F3E